jgi:hypothetical protein
MNSKSLSKKKYDKSGYGDEADEDEGGSHEEEEEDEYGDEDNGSGNDNRARGVNNGYAEDDDHWFSDSSASDGGTGSDERQPRLVMYAAWTQYDVVKEVGKNVFGYHLTKNE